MANQDPGPTGLGFFVRTDYMVYSEKQLNGGVMNHVIKTYDDGSELTTTNLAVAVGIAAIGTAVITTAYIKWVDWRAQRFIYKVYGKNHPVNK